jgi:hypothetical protein
MSTTNETSCICKYTECLGNGVIYHTSIQKYEVEFLPDICYRDWGYRGSPFSLHECDGIKLYEIPKDFPPIFVTYNICISELVMLHIFVSQ